MKPIEVAQRYFDAWNRRDPAAIAETFAEGGTYSGSGAQGLAGPALIAYTSALFEAFPDLSFDLVSVAEAGERMVAVQWLMRGTNTGPLLGGPPTGGTIALPGADFITVEGEKVLSVQGYFDQKTFVEQLGLQALVQPKAIGPLTFGSGVGMQLGKRTKPGAFSLTWIQVRSDEESQKVQDYSQQILMEMARMRGFISWTGLIIGRRLYTVTAWETPEDASQLLRGGTHREAIKMVFGTNFSEGGTTGVWIPHHLNDMWIRCTSCNRMMLYEKRDGVCECGTRLPEPLPYW